MYTRSRLTILFQCLATLIAAVFTASCTEEFDPAVESSPVAVLNVMAMPDSALTVSLTHSWRFGGKSPDRASVTLRSADVTVTVNNSETYPLFFDEDLLRYRTEFAPAPGDLLEIVAVDPTYGRVSGSTVVPLPPTVDSINVRTSIEMDENSIIFNDGQGTHDYKYVSRYTLTFTDPGDTRNYYMLAGNELDTTGDPIFDENLSALDMVFDYDWADLLMFSDTTINGTSYTLNFSTKLSLWTAWIYWHNAIYWEYDELPRFTNTIRFYGISPEYYAYLVSIYQKYGNFNADLEDVGLAEPTAIYSNVTGGTGIVCSQTPVEYIFDFTDEIVALFPTEEQ